MLRIEGPPCTSFDGRPRAVATAAAGPERARDLHVVSRRAPRLVLVVGGHELAIEGPIDVVTPGVAAAKGGLREEVLDRIAEEAGEEPLPYRTLATELRWLSDGDRVRVAGTIHRRADDGAGYREAAEGLALTGDRGPALAAAPMRAGVPALGAGLAMVAVALAITVGGSMRIEGLELVSVLHRHDALADLPLIDRLRCLGPNEHAARARVLRENALPEAALHEASRGSDPASLHEQLVLLAEAGRRKDYVETWRRLVAAQDALCSKGGRCLDHAGLAALTRTPSRWAGPSPTRAPLEVLFSEPRALGRDPALTRQMGSDLWDLHPKCALLARLRIAWLFELAGQLVVTGEHAGARRALERIEASLDDPRLGAPTRGRVRRDLHHLNAVLAIRSGRARSLTAAERHHEGGWCPMREAVQLALDPRGRHWPGAFASFGEAFAAELSAVRASGVVTQAMQYRMSLGAAEAFEHAVYFAPMTGRESNEAQREWLTPEDCPQTTTVAELMRETSRSRALDAFGAHEVAEKVIACAAGMREALAGPWGTGGDPRPERDLEEPVTRVAIARAFVQPRRVRRRPRPAYVAIVRPVLPARGVAATR